jgi:hypothetical protein
MDPSTNAEPSFAPDTAPSAPDRKRLVMIIGAVLVAGFMLVFVFILALNQNGSKKDSTNSDETSQGSRTGGNAPRSGQGISPSPGSSEGVPESVAKNFYDWYVAHPEPLGSGDYKTRIDITDEYKAIMERYVARGLPSDRDPVFNCGDLVLPKNVLTFAAEYDEDKKTAFVILQEANTDRNLFQIKLENVKGEWLVRDVWCAP